MGLRIVTIVWFLFTLFRLCPAPRQTGDQIEMGITRNAQDKKAIQQAMQDAEANGMSPLEIKQVGRQKRLELNKKSDREVQEILRVCDSVNNYTYD